MNVHDSIDHLEWGLEDLLEDLEKLPVKTMPPVIVNWCLYLYNLSRNLNTQINKREEYTPCPNLKLTMTSSSITDITGTFSLVGTLEPPALTTPQKT